MAETEFLVEALKDKICYEINLLRGVEMEILDLSNKLEMIRNVMDDSEKRGVNDQSVNNWLKKLQNTAFEMDDILDEWKYSLLKHKMEVSAEPDQKVGSSFIPSSCLIFKKTSARRDIAMKIRNVKATLDRILKERDDFNFVISQPATDHLHEYLRFQQTFFVEQPEVHGVGIHSKKSEIVRKLMLNSGDIQILSIVGMGGIGKTTLAQLIFNDAELMKYTFNVRIWLRVSDPFDVAAVARNIVRIMTTDIIPPNTNQMETVLEKLRDCISGKKFLLVLDDVRSEEENIWNTLKINLEYGALGSKILVTTRNEGVPKMMGALDDDIYHLEMLSDEECWLIMRDKCLKGKSEEECGEFKVVGKKIARECKGLPLAANIMGEFLRSKTNLVEWEHLEKSEIWQSERAKLDLFPHISLSYNELSLAHKRCFSYCAAYPKDYQFHAESLIEEWMTLGYLGYASGNSEVESKGQECFQNLAMRSLFQDIQKSESGGKIDRCKMHDIVHDFALSLWKNNMAAEMRNRSCQVCDPLSVSQAQEHRSLFWEKRIPLHICDCVTSIRILRIENGLPPVGMERLIHLRWLDFSGAALSKDDLQIICRFYFLQTLSLARCNIIEISREIGNLVHLRRLDLSGNEKLKELPESMYSLVELRTISWHGAL